MAPSKASAPFQSIFRIELKSRQDALKAHPRPFTPRKAHRKSRRGCHACKQRRVKCDGEDAFSETSDVCSLPRTETQPRCGRCVKFDVECIFADPSPPAAASALMIDPAPCTPRPDMYSMSVDLVDNDLNELLFGDTMTCGGGAASPADAIGNFRVLQHFQSVVSLTLGGSMTKAVMHGFVAKTAWSYPHLMHMVLAMSCAHRKRFEVDEDTQRQYAFAEATNWGMGLQSYRQHLGNIEQGVYQGFWDVEVATTFLQIMLTFTLDDELPMDCIDSTEDAYMHVLEPFRAIGGFRALCSTYGGVDYNSRWARVLLSTDDITGTFTIGKPGVEGLPRALVNLCGLDDDVDADNNPYHRIVRMLAPLLSLPRSEDNFPILFAFLGRIWPDLRPLMLRKDSRGLLLVAYWLALLKQVDQWWLTTRAKTKCMAIVSYLSSLHDPEINSLLPFPAAFASADTAFMWQLLEHVTEDLM